MRDHDILQIKTTASKDEIRLAFRKLAAIHHPDKGGSPEKFKEIKAAYDRLMEYKEPITGSAGHNPFQRYRGTTMDPFSTQYNYYSQDDFLLDLIITQINSLTPQNQLKLKLKLKWK